MENHHYINYPGSIAEAIFNSIKINPTAFNIGWNLSLCLLVILMSVTVYNNFKEIFRANSLINRILKSPFFFISLSLVGVFILRLPNLVLKEQNPDESQWIANAATFLNGGVLWKNVNGFTGGPLLYAPLSLMCYISDGLNYASIRLFGLLFCILPSLLFAYLTFKQVFNSAIASLLLLPLILFFLFEINHDTIAYNSEMVPMLLTAVSLYFIFLIQKKSSISKIFLTGIAIGLFPYAKLQAVPIALVISVILLIEILFFQNKSSKQKTISILSFVVGGFIPSALILFYLLHYNSFPNFISRYLFQNIYYASTGLTSHVTGIIKYLIVATIAIQTIEFLWFFIAVGILILISSVFIFRNKSRIEKSARRNLIYLFAVTVISYLSICFPGNDFTHYEFLLVIPLFVFSGMMIGTALPLVIESFSFSKTFPTYCLLTVIVPVTLIMYSGNKGIKFIRNGGNYELSVEAKEIRKYSSPNEKLAIWGWANKYYVETSLTQGTSGVNSFYEATAALNGDNSFLEKYISELEMNKPAIFLDVSLSRFQGIKKQEGLSHENFPLLNNYINKHYQLVAEINQRKIYVLKERLTAMTSILKF